METTVHATNEDLKTEVTQWLSQSDETVEYLTLKISIGFDEIVLYLTEKQFDLIKDMQIDKAIIREPIPCKD